MGPTIIKALEIIQKAGSSPKAKAAYEATLKYKKSLPGATPRWASRNLLKDPQLFPSKKNPNKLLLREK